MTRTRDEIFYAAMQARDARFDGKFFVGVKTTGIYCRPICPAKPKRENVEFFPNAEEARAAGYRACRRCRPDSAPKSAAWIGKTAVVQRAVGKIQTWAGETLDEDGFAARFGMTARHLRRLFVDEIGTTPKQLFLETRLSLARQLVTETRRSLTEIALAAGYGSVRRFNESFKTRFNLSPTAMRKQETYSRMAEKFTLSLPYRPPFDFEGLLRFYGAHQIGNLERFEPGQMHRRISFGGHHGKISVTDDPAGSRLLVAIDFPDLSVIPWILGRVRNLFDLDSDPSVVAGALAKDPELKKIHAKHPGIRLPSGWDPFESAIGLILGQFVSLERARTLVSDLIEIAGERVDFPDGSGLLFPTPEAILTADLGPLKTTSVRKQTLKDFSRAVVEKKISLEPTQDVERFVTDAMSIRGIGPWTARGMTLKVLRHADAFPATDLILARALELHPISTIDSLSPWRGYVAILLWREYAGVLKKKPSPRAKTPREKKRRKK